MARARLVRLSTTYVLNKLEGSLADIAQELAGRDLAVPPVAAALVERARGEPEALVREAVALRAAATPLWSDLAALVRSADPLSTAGRQQLRDAVNDWIGVVKKEVGLAPAPQFRDAIEVRAVIGFPVPSMSLNKLAVWVKHRLAARRVAVLTEISRRIEASDRQDAACARLAQLCSGS